jgi:hypothetical protein
MCLDEAHQWHAFIPIPDPGFHPGLLILNPDRVRQSTDILKSILL